MKGELFYDCGNDGICNQDEENYNPNGTEGNNIWDYGEWFLDTGRDGLALAGA